MTKRKKKDNTILALYLPNSQETKSSRARLLADFLSYYATGRNTPALTIQKRQGKRSNLKTDTVEMLAAFREKRLTESDQLKSFLEHYNQNFRYGTAQFLKEVSATRITSSSTQAVKLKEEAQERKTTIQQYLAELRRKRESKHSPQIAAQPADVLKIESENKESSFATTGGSGNLLETSGSEPITEEVESDSSPEPIGIDELFLFLMTHAEKFNMNQLEQYFGPERLGSQWNEFVTLFEEFKPGSREELERLREHQVSLYAVVSY
jgi:hypothetical protein